MQSNFSPKLFWHLLGQARRFVVVQDKPYQVALKMLAFTFTEHKMGGSVNHIAQTQLVPISSIANLCKMLNALLSCFVILLLLCCSSRCSVQFWFLLISICSSPPCFAFPIFSLPPSPLPLIFTASQDVLGNFRCSQSCNLPDIVTASQDARPAWSADPCMQVNRWTGPCNVSY